MRILVALLRLTLAAAMAAAVTVTFVASTQPVNPFNFFGYFTIQSNSIGAAVLLATGVAGLVSGRQGPVLSFLRAGSTTFLVIVGGVYAVLLAPLGEAGGAPVPWANTVMHLVAPIAVAADWLLIGDRTRLPFSRLWWILSYPVVWIGVVLVRGATDGWVPYPFLNPRTQEFGYWSVAAYSAGIAVAFLIVGALVIAISRGKGLVLLRA